MYTPFAGRVSERSYQNVWFTTSDDATRQLNITMVMNNTVICTMTQLTDHYVIIVEKCNNLFVMLHWLMCNKLYWSR